MGDFNAKVGTEEVPERVGKYGLNNELFWPSLITCLRSTFETFRG